MVSRSLEKMMLIAIGLSAAVIVGVPVLLYSMNLLNNTGSYQAAESFANQLHSYVDTVDKTNTSVIQDYISVPEGVTVSSDGNILTVTYYISSQNPVTWIETYNHAIDLIPPAVADNQIVRVELVGDDIQIRFMPHP